MLSPKTHNINCHFDNAKYKQLRLRAFYAVPKMVVIPSTASLRKRKVMSALESTGAAPQVGACGTRAWSTPPPRSSAPGGG